MELQKFQMAVYGRRLDDGGVCDSCGKHRAVVWVQELEGGRCSSCLAGTTDGRGRPRGPRRPSQNPEDIEWLKEHFPEHYKDMYETPDGEVPETVEDIVGRAGKMGPPSPPRPVEDVPEDPPPASSN